MSDAGRARDRIPRCVLAARSCARGGTGGRRAGRPNRSGPQAGASPARGRASLLWGLRAGFHRRAWQTRQLAGLTLSGSQDERRSVGCLAHRPLPSGGLPRFAARSNTGAFADRALAPNPQGAGSLVAAASTIRAEAFAERCVAKGWPDRNGTARRSPACWIAAAQQSSLQASGRPTQFWAWSDALAPEWKGRSTPSQSTEVCGPHKPTR